MTPTFAWVLIAFITMPNGGSTSSIVPGIATAEACHTLAGQLGLPNHQCVSYPAAGGQPSAANARAPEATNSITQWALTVRSVHPGEPPIVLQGIASEAACERAAEQFGESADSNSVDCTPYEAPRPTKIVRQIVQPQSRGLFW